MKLSLRKGKKITTEPSAGSKTTSEQNVNYISEKSLASQANTDSSSGEVAVAVTNSSIQELNDVKERYKRFDQEHTWAFIAGQTSEDFRGNPKYLFVYINRYRPDIAAYWLCNKEETLEQVRSLGFTAHQLSSPAGQYAIDHTGVLVVEMAKVVIPAGFEDVKYINLWHGVGLKRIERQLMNGDIAMEMAQKYIHHNAFFRDHQLMTVTSPTIEKEFVNDCGLEKENVLRTGYLRCEYQQNFEPIHSFDPDLKSQKGLPETTKIAVYAPTYRTRINGSFSPAVPNLPALYECCERNDLLLIFKVHPRMEQEESFVRARETYGDSSRFWFWDNQEDFYEIIDRIDLAIVDYSSILSDFVAAGVPHYIRYIYDYEEYMAEDVTQKDAYFERTTGQICQNFDELLEAIDSYRDRDDSAEFQRINDTLWAYAGGKEDFEKTIQAVFDFNIVPRSFPTLYSFDIFDTLISRKVLDPVGIFYAVQERMLAHGGFPAVLLRQYPAVRQATEANVREYYRKTTESRGSEKIEIRFEEIFARMQAVYQLTDEQVELLMDWELKEELDNVVPLPKQICLVKELLTRGETVVLICDMYLPKEIILQMLEKADPILPSLPLFLSNVYGVQKTTRLLFFEVYKSFEPFYDFKKWIHYGDTLQADQTPARRLNICTRKSNGPSFNAVQQSQVSFLESSDGYRVAAMQARMYQDSFLAREEFVISYVSLFLVPYIDWVIRDAVRQGYQTLYFISRDGHHMKPIADAIIRERNLDLKTKYIYGSRRAWRIPSNIDEIDKQFWFSYGNFGAIVSKEGLFQAMDLDEETFRSLFPTVDPDHINFLDKASIASLSKMFRDNEAYQAYLLKTAAEERKLVEGYFRQEIDPTESFAMVEYWGRGYTQECMSRIWNHLLGEEVDLPFYYCRTILPSEGHCIRYNMTTNTTQLLFMEAIFANVPYQTVERYELKDDETYVPVIIPCHCDKNLYAAMEKLLPELASQYAALELNDPEGTDRLLLDFALDYYEKNLDNTWLVENISTLVDSIAQYGKQHEFAPPYTMENLEQFANKESTRGTISLTSSITMSVARSSPEVREKYFEMYQIFPGDNVAGGRLLPEKKIQTNREFRQSYEKLMEEAEVYKKLYEEAVQNHDVKNKIVLVSDKASLLDTGLDLLNRRLKEIDDLELVTLFMYGKEQRNAQDVVNELAEARFIVVYRPIDVFCTITFRDETQEVLLDNVAFHFYQQKLAAIQPLKWKEKYKHLAGFNDVSVLQIPSASMEKRWRRFYSKNVRTDCSLLGNCNTDLYFDPSVGKEARDELKKLFPEANGKKIILYMPALRPRNGCKDWMYLLDMDVLRSLIGDEYVVMIYLKQDGTPHNFKNILEIPGFSKNITTEFTARQLMLAADVILGDYRDTFYESALLNKPVYFTAGDYEERLMNKNVDIANRFEEYMFGPLINTPRELADHLAHIDSYDYEPMHRFREHVLGGCDGHSVDRVVSYLLNHLNPDEETDFIPV